MSLFGKLDAELISTNPFKVDKGEYEATVVEARYNTNKNDVRQLVIQYEITNEDSEFKGNKVAHYLDLVDSDMTQEKLEMMPADEKKKIRMSLAKLKKTLCGNEGNVNHKGLGVDINDLNEDWNPEILVGTAVRLGINTNGKNNEYTNVQWVNLQD